MGPDNEDSRFCQATRRYTLRDNDILSLLVGPQITLNKPLGEATTLRCLHIPSPEIGYSQETKFIHPGHSNTNKAPADPAARGTNTDRILKFFVGFIELRSILTTFSISDPCYEISGQLHQ